MFVTAYFVFKSSNFILTLIQNGALIHSKPVWKKFLHSLFASLHIHVAEQLKISTAESARRFEYIAAEILRGEFNSGFVILHQIFLHTM